MQLVKKCRHGRGVSGREREKAWRACRCAWLVAEWHRDRRRWTYANVGPELERAERSLRARQAPAEGDGLEAVAERYLDALRRAARAPRTLDQYRVYLARGLEWYGVAFPVAQIDTAALEDFRGALIQSGRDPDYAKCTVGFHRAVLRHALREGLIERLPDLAPPIAVHRGRRADRLTLEECERLVAHMEPPWRAAGELILLTGLRIGELMALTPESVEQPGLLRVTATLGRDGAPGPPKTDTSRRAIRLTPRARALVAARVLEARPGERLWPGRIEGRARGAMRRALKASDLEAPGRGWHKLRHGHRDLLELAGVSIRAAAARLGHGHQFATTEVYGWGSEAEDVSAVDAVRNRHGGLPASD